MASGEQKYAQNGFVFQAMLKNISVDGEAGKDSTQFAQQTCIKVCGMKPLLIPAERDEYLKCIMCASPNRGRHFVRLHGTDLILNTIGKNIEKLMSRGALEVIVNPAKGTLVLAKCEKDEPLCRCVVHAKSEPKKTSLYAVDYGTCYMVDSEEIYRLEDEELMNVPPLAFCVKIDGIEEIELTKDYFNYFKQCDTVALKLLDVAKDDIAFIVDMAILDKGGDYIPVTKLLGESVRDFFPSNNRIVQKPEKNENFHSYASNMGRDRKQNHFERTYTPHQSMNLAREEKFSDGMQCDHPPGLCDCVQLENRFHEAVRKEEPSSRQMRTFDTRNNSKSFAKCYNCGEMGHISRECVQARNVRKADSFERGSGFSGITGFTKSLDVSQQRASRFGGSSRGGQITELLNLPPKLEDNSRQHPSQFGSDYASRKNLVTECSSRGKQSSRFGAGDGVRSTGEALKRFDKLNGGSIGDSFKGFLRGVTVKTTGTVLNEKEVVEDDKTTGTEAFSEAVASSADENRKGTDKVFGDGTVKIAETDAGENEYKGTGFASIPQKVLEKAHIGNGESEKVATNATAVFNSASGKDWENDDGNRVPSDENKPHVAGSVACYQDDWED